MLPFTSISFADALTTEETESAPSCETGVVAGEFRPLLLRRAVSGSTVCKREYASEHKACDFGRIALSEQQLFSAPRELAIRSVGTPPENATCTWWLSRILQLEPSKCTGWVLAQVLEEYRKEEEISKVCGFKTMDERLASAGLQDLATNMAPRKRCKEIACADERKHNLLDECGQRSMIAAIGCSVASYMS